MKIAIAGTGYVGLSVNDNLILHAFRKLFFIHGDT